MNSRVIEVSVLILKLVEAEILSALEDRVAGSVALNEKSALLSIT